jgi:hypothetical protein
MRKILAMICVWVMAFALLTSAVFAARIGFRDVLWPVSLPAQLLGIAFVFIGLTGLAGFALGLLNSLGLAKGAKSWRLTLIMAGSFGAAYADSMIALYSYRYQDIKQFIFIALAALCFILGCLALPKAWGYLSQGLRAAGVVITLIVAGIGAWYHNVYIPHNAPVGIDYGLTTQSVASSGRDTLVSLQITMRSLSPVPVQVLGSMVIVKGISYASGRWESPLSDSLAQQRMINYADNQSANPDIRFSGTPEATTLAVQRPIRSSAFMFPGQTYTDDFVVIVPDPQVKVLTVSILFQYVRSTRVVFGNELPSRQKSLSTCPDNEDVRSYWNIDQSALRTFTNGSLILYSDWCASLSHPSIDFGILGAHNNETPAEQQSLAASLGAYTSSRDETFVIP